MKKSILFVDDERAVLEGLRNRLRHQRRLWDMVFVESGRDALIVLDRDPVDIIVSDMRMPGMDGAALLQRVRETRPSVARIVLSGHADEREMLRALATAHYFLPKPCDPGLLEDVIARVCNLQSLLNDDSVKRAIGRLDALPAVPATYSRLMTALADDRSCPRTVADILNQDSALSTRILHVVNSAYFKLRKPIVRVEDAVVFLGIGTVRQIALVAGVFDHASCRKTVPEQQLVELQAHALLTASLATTIVTDASQKDWAFIAALLHDIGKLFLMSEFPERVQEILEETRASRQPIPAVEARLHGVTHAEIGAYLLGLWQMPFPIVEAVANHHAPSRVQHHGGVNTLAAVHIANALAAELSPADWTRSSGVHPGFDDAFIASLGVSDMLSGWRATAEKLAQQRSTKPAWEG